MTVTSGIRCVPDMARFWSAKTPDKAALIDTDRVVTYAYSAEVERALAAHPSVQSVAVVGAPDQKWGERVVAFVVPYPDAPVDVSDLVSHCRDLIAGYKVPKEIHLTDALPQTASGKVQKAALRQQLQASQQQRI